ncbi:MAG: DUF6733 family protein [Bacteroidota bacterium]
MKKFIQFLPFTLLSFFLQAQETGSFQLVLNQDNAFGFYPQVVGSRPISERFDLTAYGLFWTNPSFGSPATGTNFWTETGIGISSTTLQDRLVINPSIGFTHGNLLSGAEQGLLAEGIVPSLLLLYLDDRFETEAFVAYYQVLRREGPINSSFALYWIYPGIYLHPAFSVGIHYESFRLTETNAGDTGPLYTWTGGYIKYTIQEKYALRFSAGINVAEDSPYASEYYKLNVVIPFE